MNPGIASMGVRGVGRGGGPRDASASAASIGLWVFMGVATALFSLFIVAYVMRMSGDDSMTIALPWQLWLSSALLVGGSMALQWAAAASRDAGSARSRRLLLAGGLGAAAFLGVQLWAWQVLWSAQVMPAGNPAGSFFYLLTAMHGLHLAGGLVGWAWTARVAWVDPAAAAWRVALCARYWHFMLAVWLVLFGLLGWVTPEVARFVCGTS
ncbi:MULTISPECIES: bb3-type cytochrome oxidase subunit III [unclassified Variovorax]|jgi:cytochrome c oxidase subunit 3|uniref:bb3-type cytochrome oxidase subunit III n=1 Tax=unclassified Variovorax TaxID=663243 RepID=UPI000F7E5876|nr:MULTISPECIES: bb3-type cytochrome oxidase subunit III [unclassified Variovorax]RSZ38412.1 bb3-type cytochrome oxidase subunit III [Variovorax sp. 553]RSZ39136.1 bb3-type cytochrome oxidase subunit III [Variovorax sp. 679]